MALAHFRVLINKLFNKDPYIFLEEDPMIVLDIKSDMCMDNTGNDTKHTRHIARRISFVRNVEKYKIHKIYWCEGGMQLADTDTKNVGEHDLTPRMKYIMLRLDNWDRTLVQEGWKNIG